MPDDFVILRAMKSIAEINSLITCGDWTQAAILLMNLSCSKLEIENEALFNAMPVQWKTRVLEYAAVIIFLLKFGVSYLPDYCLSYIDFQTDFEAFYGDDTEIGLKRKKSSLMRQKSRDRTGSKGEEESKAEVMTLGRGRKTKELIDAKKEAVYYEQYNDDYYDEMDTYKRNNDEHDGYYDEEEEDDMRPLIDHKVMATSNVEKPDPAML